MNNPSSMVRYYWSVVTADTSWPVPGTTKVGDRWCKPRPSRLVLHTDYFKRRTRRSQRVANGALCCHVMEPSLSLLYVPLLQKCKVMFPTGFPASILRQENIWKKKKRALTEVHFLNCRRQRILLNSSSLLLEWWRNLTQTIFFFFFFFGLVSLTPTFLSIFFFLLLLLFPSNVSLIWRPRVWIHSGRQSILWHSDDGLWHVVTTEEHSETSPSLCTTRHRGRVTGRRYSLSNLHGRVLMK